MRENLLIDSHLTQANPRGGISQAERPEQPGDVSDNLETILLVHRSHRDHRAMFNMPIAGRQAPGQMPRPD